MSLFRWALLCFFVAVPAMAQSQTFEKIKIRPVRSVDPRSMRLQVLPDGELIAHAVLVIDLISYAYDVPSNPSPRLNSLPDWIYGDRYDIEAKASPYAITTTSRDGETQLRVKQMIRRLLADRFGLVMRVDRQRMPTYAMTVSSSGLRLQPLGHPERLHLRYRARRLPCLCQRLRSSSERKRCKYGRPRLLHRELDRSSTREPHQS